MVINGQGGVEIGEAVLIAAFEALFAGNHVTDNPDIPIRDQGMTTKGGIKIEDNVWLGTHVVVLDGVTVGTGSVIAEGALVTKNVPPLSIVAGVPGKVIAKRK